MSDSKDNDLPDGVKNQEPENIDAHEEVKTQGVGKHIEASPRLTQLVEGLELFSANRRSSSVSFSDLSDKQKDKALDIAEKNESHAFEYQMKKLDVFERLNSKQIDASTVGRRTIRYLAYCGIGSVVLLTILILFFKSDFFIPWLTFLTGLAGGFGISKATKGLTKEHKIADPTSKVEEDDD